MKQFLVKTASGSEGGTFFQEFAETLPLISENKDLIIKNAIIRTALYDKYLFYPMIGKIFGLLGYNASVTRDGDTNNRSDAFLEDTTHSIPIEIKSPTEVEYVNNKSIRQALENKIILLSRKFHPTTRETTSLALGFTYPADRSGVFDLVEDIYNAYGLNIGVMSFEDLLRILWDAVIEDIPFDKVRITFLKGQFQ